MSCRFVDRFNESKNIINDYSRKFLYNLPESTIKEAIIYSFFSGGKRVRPILCLNSFLSRSDDSLGILPYAFAIELIHTYSLIHDDLPAMDNDDFRRGKLTSHKKFGEAVAILTGDALLNYAFEVMIEDLSRGNTPTKINTIYTILRASGINGMIYGQLLDIENENTSVDDSMLFKIHANKTGKLIEASIISGAMLSGLYKNHMDGISEFSKILGMAFQIKDDLLDYIGEEAKVGKALGKDAKNGKNTYVTFFGVEKSQRILKESIEKCIALSYVFEGNAVFFEDFARYLLNRED